MKATIVLLAALAASALLAPSMAVKDDSYSAYLEGTAVSALGISSLAGTPYLGSAVGTGFLTLADLGKNATAWTLDISQPLPNQIAVNLYYYNETNKANPPLLLTLGTDFSDFTPYGNFTVAQFNAALTGLGLPTVSGDTPYIGLINAGNILAGWVSSDGKASVGQASAGEVGPPVPDFDETYYLSNIDNSTVTFSGIVGIAGGALIDITDNKDDTFTFNLFLSLLRDANNATIQTPQSLDLVFASSTGAPLTALNLPLTPDQWAQASRDDGYQGTFSKKDLVDGILQAGGEGTTTLFAALTVSDATGSGTNYGAFEPLFQIDAEFPSPPPRPIRRRPPPRRRAPPPRKQLSPKPKSPKPKSPKPSPKSPKPNKKSPKPNQKSPKPNKKSPKPNRKSPKPTSG